MGLQVLSNKQDILTYWPLIMVVWMSFFSCSDIRKHISLFEISKWIIAYKTTSIDQRLARVGANAYICTNRRQAPPLLCVHSGVAWIKGVKFMHEFVILTTLLIPLMLTAVQVIPVAWEEAACLADVWYRTSFLGIAAVNW